MNKGLVISAACIVMIVILSCRSGSPSTSPKPLNSATNLNTKTLQFSGYDWLVKSSEERVGPGPNYFSDSTDNVSVDAQGRLHLRLTQKDGRWFCAEVISKQNFGYGTYQFHLSTMPGTLDPQVILGLFTWNDDPAYHHREIDIEVSRWGQANNQNAQFVVQPYTNPKNIRRFQIPPDLSFSVHSFTWKPDSVSLQSSRGETAKSQEIIQQHTFTSDIPQAGGENPRINLWLLSGHAPTDGKEVEVLISKFEFIPLQ